MIRAASQTAHDGACEYLRAMTHREAFYQTQSSDNKIPIDRTKDGFLRIETRPDESGVEEKNEKLERDREKLCRWVCEVTQTYEFDSRIVACTMNYFDRFLAKIPETHDDIRKKRLLIMTCLSTSIKVHGSQQNKVLGLRQLMSACPSAYTSIDEMVELEKELFTTLNWLLHPPTCVDYIWPICVILRDYLPWFTVDYVYFETVEIVESLTQTGTLEFRRVLPSSLAVGTLAYCLNSRNCLVDLCSELHRYDIHVNWHESNQCFQDLFQFFAVIPDHDATEKNGTSRDNRMASPVGVAVPRGQDSVSV